MDMILTKRFLELAAFARESRTMSLTGPGACEMAMKDQIILDDWLAGNALKLAEEIGALVTQGEQTGKSDS